MSDLLIFAESDSDYAGDSGDGAADRFSDNLFLARKKTRERTRLKSGVVATMGETMATWPVVSATNVSKAPSASKTHGAEEYRLVGIVST